MAPAYQYSSKYKKFNQNYITNKKLEGGCWRRQAKAFWITKKKFKLNSIVGKHIAMFKIKFQEYYTEKNY